MKTIIFLFVFFGLSIVACKKNEQATHDPDITDFADIKTDTWQDNIGKVFTVEGIFVNTTGATKLLRNAEDYYVDGLTKETDYIHLSFSTDIIQQMDLSQYFGKKVKCTGICTQSKDKSIQGTSKILGQASVTTIEIVDPKNVIVMDEHILLEPVSILSFCERFPLLCAYVTTPAVPKKALLYSGGINSSYAYIRYWNDLKLMYYILRNRGYAEENIRVVYKNGTGEDMSIPVHYAANMAGLSNAFNYLNARMNGQDKFFLMMNNHGGGRDLGVYGNTGVNDSDGDDNRGSISDNVDEQYYFYNSSAVLSDDWIANRINSLNFGSMIAVVKPCYSGGIIWDLRGDNRVILTSGTEFQVTYSHSSGQFGAQTFHFFSAVFGKNPITNASIDADTDNNGTVSMYEAQQYILANDSRPEQPQYDDDGDGVANIPGSSGYGNNVSL